MKLIIQNSRIAATTTDGLLAPAAAFSGGLLAPPVAN